MTCIVDWSNVCLVCLQKGEHLSVFQKEEDSCSSIADKIMKCSDFSIKEDTDQPHNICAQCLDDLNVAFKFRQNCDQSNSIIKAIISNDNRELEVSGLRIKIPSGLKVKKITTESSDNTNDETSFAASSIKHEEEDGKASDENFDSTDYLEHTEVLEEDDDEEQRGPLESAFEVIEKLELMSELEDLKPALKNPKSRISTASQKRGRGRPKKSFSRTDGPDYLELKTEVSSVPQKTKAPPEAKPQKICEICGNSYKYQHALNSHMRRHRNERPFNCEFCDKAFVSAVELRRHMRVHTGQKPYECQYCDRRFSDYGSRIKHERTHTGERPYVCLTCGKSFAYAHVLTVHMRTHTGEKKYMCTECGRGFTKKAYLDNHMTHHNTGTAGDDAYETSEAAAAIAEEYEEKMQIEGYVVLPTNGRIKPKEECDDVILQDEFHTIGHISVP